MTHLQRMIQQTNGSSIISLACVKNIFIKGHAVDAATFDHYTHEIVGHNKKVKLCKKCAAIRAKQIAKK